MQWDGSAPVANSATHLASLRSLGDLNLKISSSKPEEEEEDEDDRSTICESEIEREGINGMVVLNLVMNCII